MDKELMVKEISETFKALLYGADFEAFKPIKKDDQLWEDLQILEFAEEAYTAVSFEYFRDVNKIAEWIDYNLGRLQITYIYEFLKSKTLLPSQKKFREQSPIIDHVDKVNRVAAALFKMIGEVDPIYKLPQNHSIWEKLDIPDFVKEVYEMGEEAEPWELDNIEAWLWGEAMYDKVDKMFDILYEARFIPLIGKDAMDFKTHVITQLLSKLCPNYKVHDLNLEDDYWNIEIRLIREKESVSAPESVEWKIKDEDELNLWPIIVDLVN